MMIPHNEAVMGMIAKTVLMPGDPLRAKMIAEKYLENVQLVNKLRCMYAFTGTYKGKEITVMASGMGMPSIGIYSYELYKFYGVENIIRVGSAGAYTDKLDLYDVVLATGSYSQSTYAKVQNNEDSNILYGDEGLNNKIIAKANELGLKLNQGIVHSTDVFYQENNNYKELYEKYGCIGVEMESFALFHNAKTLGKKAACLVTISDSLVTNALTSPEERQNSFNKMIELALETTLDL